MSRVDDLRIHARRAEADGELARDSRLYLRAISRHRAGDAMPDPGLLVRVGDLEYRKGDRGAALDCYRRAAEGYAEQGLITNAVAVCKKALRHLPHEHTFHALLAELHLDIGLTADARDHILRFDDEAPERDPAGPALAALRSFLEREPDQEVTLRLAERLEARGRTDGALEVLEEVWRKRVRGGLEVEALRQRVEELAPDVDPDAWSRPRLELHAGRRDRPSGDGGGGDAGRERGVGEQGILEELTAGDGPAGRGRGRKGPAGRVAPSGPLDALRTLAGLVKGRDFEAERHAERVGDLAAGLAGEIGLASEALELLRSAAPLHDVGMVVVPDRVLLEEGRLTSGEREIMMTHPAAGARILSGSDHPVIRLAREIAHTHHERWDGKGYPRGLRGEEIPLSGRIVAVADSFVALTRERPLGEAASTGEALRAIEAGRETQFDPRIVDALMVLKDRLPLPVTPAGGDHAEAL